MGVDFRKQKDSRIRVISTKNKIYLSIEKEKQEMNRFSMVELCQIYPSIDTLSEVTILEVRQNQRLDPNVIFVDVIANDKNNSGKKMILNLKLDIQKRKLVSCILTDNIKDVEIIENGLYLVKGEDNIYFLDNLNKNYPEKHSLNFLYPERTILKENIDKTFMEMEKVNGYSELKLFMKNDVISFYVRQNNHKKELQASSYIYSRKDNDFYDLFEDKLNIPKNASLDNIFLAFYASDIRDRIIKEIDVEKKRQEIERLKKKFLLRKYLSK